MKVDDILKTLLERSRDIILILDDDFNIRFSSSTFKDITGIDPDKIGGDISISDFVIPEDRNRLLAVIRRVLRGISVSDMELGIVDKDGSYRRLLASWIKRSSDEGGGIIFLAKDITEYKRIEEELKKRTEALETILFSLSHDLKGPLFTLKGMGLLFKKSYYERLDTQGRHFVERIEENIIKLERIISNMLDISRFERQVLNFEDVSLKELIQVLIRDMGEYIKECNAEIIVDVNLPTLRCDRDKLYIALKNLLDNSLKYRSMHRPLKVQISGRMSDRGFELIFEDNGSGIESKFLDRVFRPFSRAISSEDAPPGHGIGLAIVKGIIDAHGADIKVESSYGEWTRFRIFFDKSRVVKINS